ncbi:MAG: diacylglycerol kinase [Planctomycetes bacterium]|nr:diacylglycerol kinase [Planctomycetota bacterium]
MSVSQCDKQDDMHDTNTRPATTGERRQVHPPHRHRSAWREEIVLAERGLVRGIRCDSAFFIHFFGISIVVAIGMVLGVGWMQWIAIMGCLTVVLTAQMFNQSLKSLANVGESEPEPHVERALVIGKAAVLVACIGSTLILAVIFGHRIQELFAD